MQHAEALSRAGYEVEIFAQHTDERELGKLNLLEAAATVATGYGRSPNLGNFAPDIIHVHNLFPNYGKAWISSATAPVISTLHNYRPLCSAGILFRGGRVCTDCLDSKSSLPAVLHGCYRGRAQTVPVALGQRFDKDVLLTGSTGLIALSEQMKALYLQAGVPAEKIHVLPNFLPSSLDVGKGSGGNYWLYAGRFSEDKGILDLLSQWPEEKRLIVAGSGELDTAVRAAAGSNVEIIGAVKRDRLVGLMRGAKGLVFPSKWFEGFPMVYPEALASGTPILTWKPSVVADLVRAEGTGLVADGLSVRDAVAAAEGKFDGLRDHCRSVFEGSYTEGRWTTTLASIYRGAIATAQELA